MTSTLEFAVGDGGLGCIGFSGARGEGDSEPETKVAELLPPSVLVEKTQLSSTSPSGDLCQVLSSLDPSEKGPTESISIPELFFTSMTSPVLSSHCCESLPTIR
jgi:hypothetical protein